MNLLQINLSFMHNQYVEIIVRALAVYFFMIIAIRIFGKKELAQLSVIDLVFILLISNAVQNADSDNHEKVYSQGTDNNFNILIVYKRQVYLQQIFCVNLAFFILLYIRYRNH